MKHILFVAAAVIGLSAPAHAQTESYSCRADLAALMQQWQQQGVDAPSKPSQGRAVTRDGRVLSGAEATAMNNAVRFAAADCEKGDSQSAQQEIAVVRTKLASLH